MTNDNNNNGAPVAAIPSMDIKPGETFVLIKLDPVTRLAHALGSPDLQDPLMMIQFVLNCVGAILDAVRTSKQPVSRIVKPTMLFRG